MIKRTESGLPIVNQQQLTKLLSKAKDKGIGVLVLGLPGIGKTYTMNNWLKETYPNNLQLISYSSDKISSDYSLFGPKLFTDTEIPGNKLPYIGRIPLFIDDLGTEKLASHYGSNIDVIENIILKSYSTKDIPLYATSNLNLQEINLRYGPRILDRLKEMCAIVVLEGPNKRGVLFEENQKLVTNI